MPNSKLHAFVRRQFRTAVIAIQFTSIDKCHTRSTTRDDTRIAWNCQMPTCSLKLGQVVVAVADWPNVGRRRCGRPISLDRRWLSAVEAWEGGVTSSMNA